MRKILVLLAHPKYEHSHVNLQLTKAISGLDNVEIRDLYQLYPDFDIDVQAEQEVLLLSDVIVWQHPLYWYSCPPLMKQWIDLVLEFGWAYGPGGIYLKNKLVLSSITSGGTDAAYSKEGRHGHTLEEFLLPLLQTAKLCNMRYLPPFHVGGTHRIQKDELLEAAAQYRNTILFLRDSPEIPAELGDWKTLTTYGR